MFIDESRTASKYTNGASVGRGNPTEILIHHWGVDGQTHDGVVSFFERESTGTSAHFVVSEGRIHCLVSTADVAWHAGDWAVNLRSIGIECRPEATDGDYKAVAWLIGWLREQFGNIPLAPHRKYAQTACPGRYDLARLDREASGTISTQTSNITPIQEDTLSTQEVERIINEVGTMLEQHHSVTRAAVAKVPAQVVEARFTRVGTDGKAVGQTTIAAVLGTHDANVVLTRGVITGAAEAVAKTVAAISTTPGIDPAEQGRLAAAAFLAEVGGLQLAVIKDGASKDVAK